MGYSIVFENKYIKLSDGRYIHFERGGCNNDDAGRTKWDFSAEICTFENIVKEANYYKENSEPYKEYKCMNLKIGSRCTTMYDYGEHLLRMLKRAIPYEQFINDFYFKVNHLIGFYVSTPEKQDETFYTIKEFHKIVSRHRDGVRYRRVIEHLDVNNENKLVELIENHEPMTFYIEKRK